MAYMIMTRDKPGAEEIRAANRVAHYAFLRSHRNILIASGGLQNENGEFNGGLIVIDVDTREEAEEFLRADPFSDAGLFGDVTISRWKQAFLDRAER
ncbi:hypothetical protein JT55_06360 [Rhodovulum sp. NI22]|jgi:uncharacterized protein YciI|nr:hypothetical protein JT55_06360 [Rhodovulum sp. NI22]